MSGRCQVTRWVHRVAGLLAIRQLSELKLPWQYLPTSTRQLSCELTIHWPQGHPTLSQSAMSLLKRLANSWIILKILCSRSTVGSSTSEYLRFRLGGQLKGESKRPITWRIASGYRIGHVGIDMFWIDIHNQPWKTTTIGIYSLPFLLLLGNTLVADSRFRACFTMSSATVQSTPMETWGVQPNHSTFHNQNAQLEADNTCYYQFSQGFHRFSYHFHDARWFHRFSQWVLVVSPSSRPSCWKGSLSLALLLARRPQFR